MDKVRHFFISHDGILKYSLLTLMGVHFISCYKRADYNLILYIMMYFVWIPVENVGVVTKEVSRQEKGFCFILLIFTLLLDLTWMGFLEGEGKGNWVLLKIWLAIKIFSLVAKVLLLGVLYITDEDSILSMFNKKIYSFNENDEFKSSEMRLGDLN